MSASAAVTTKPKCGGDSGAAQRGPSCCLEQLLPSPVDHAKAYGMMLGMTERALGVTSVQDTLRFLFGLFWPASGSERSGHLPE